MPKTPTYVIELARQAGGEVWTWKEYPFEKVVAIVLKDGRKFTFKMPPASKPMSMPHSKSDGKSPAKRTHAKPRKEKDA